MAVELAVERERCTKLQEAVEAAKVDAAAPMLAYRLNEQIVMAGQPQPEDWECMAKEGFGLVINIRSDAERAAFQGGRAREAGLDYVHLPLPVYELEMPHLAEFREVLNDARQRYDKILIHCRTASRTALLWMLARMVYDGLTQEEAEAELAAAGYGEEDMEVFQFCAEDYFERAVSIA